MEIQYNNYNFLFNPFAKFFKGLKSKEEIDQDEQVIKNTVTTSEQDYLTKFNNQFTNGQFFNQFANFDQIFNSKFEKIRKYREMENYPEIDEAITTVCDEAVHIEDGDAIKFEIKNEEDILKSKAKQIREQANFIINDIFDFNDEAGWRHFRKFVVEGELYFEKILNKSKDSLAAVKLVPCFRITPVYKENIIVGYVHGTLDKQRYAEAEINLQPEQVAYINWGEYINGDILDPKSYLWGVIRAYNQLKQLEDALLIYRLNRSIERRVFNVEVGDMPRGKAEEFLKKTINTYKKITAYDPTTGTVRQSQNLMSMIEDFWFTQRDGKSSKVETLQSGMNLGEIKDVDYFLKKLYKSLKLPKSRWDDASPLFGSGKNGEISREEIKFSQFISRIQNRYKKLFIDCLVTQLKLKGFEEEYLNPKLYDFVFTKANYFSEYKDLELTETKISLLSNMFSLIWSPTNPNGVFDKEFALKHFFKMTTEDYLENQELLDSKREEIQKAKDIASIDRVGEDNEFVDDNLKSDDSEEDDEIEIKKSSKSKKKQK